MTTPLMVLAVCAALAGAFGPTHWFEHHLEHTAQLHVAESAGQHAFDWLTATLGTTVAVVGLLLSFVMYAGARGVSPIPARLAGAFGPLYRASVAKFGVDELYTSLIVWPTRFLGHVADFVDKALIGGVVQGVAWAPRIFGGSVLARIQNGLVQYYAAVTAMSVVVLFVALLFFI